MESQSNVVIATVYGNLLWGSEIRGRLFSKN